MAKGENDRYIRSTIISFFNILIFKRIDKNRFKITNDFPEWFKKLFPHFQDKKQQFYDLVDLFPFMEIFLYEAEDFWEANNDGHIQSGLWTEESPDGEEIYLHAIAAQKSHDKFILIKSDAEFSGEKRKIVQTARQNALDYERLEKAETALKKLLKFKEQFVSIISHDLRNPVSGVIGLVNLMLDDENFTNSLNSTYKEFMEHIILELHHLMDYNTKLYHWSNLELGKFKLTIKKARLIDLVDNSYWNLQNRMNEKQITFNTDINDTLTVDVDTSLFSQVLNNLLSNAVKFTPAGGTISVSSKTKENHTILCVKDSGIGIDDEHKKNLFKDYDQDHTFGTNGEIGTGLGLAICKKILDSHGFSIRMESQPGEGSEFIITI